MAENHDNRTDAEKATSAERIDSIAKVFQDWMKAKPADAMRCIEIGGIATASASLEEIGELMFLCFRAGWVISQGAAA